MGNSCCTLDDEDKTVPPPTRTIEYSSKRNNSQIKPKAMNNFKREIDLSASKEYTSYADLDQVCNESDDPDVPHSSFHSNQETSSPYMDNLSVQIKIST
jgi:hypothetical protein